MHPPTHMPEQAQQNLAADRRRQARRTALILASVAAMFFIGVILRHSLFGG